MPMYVIERTFAEQLDMDSDDVKLLEEINADEGVSWLFSFLSADRHRSYCLYEAPESRRDHRRRQGGLGFPPTRSPKSAGSPPTHSAERASAMTPDAESEQLRALQAPLKESYRAMPEAALVTLSATGTLDDGISCSVQTGRALARAGLHPATRRRWLTAVLR